MSTCSPLSPPPVRPVSYMCETLHAFAQHAEGLSLVLQNNKSHVSMRELCTAIHGPPFFKWAMSRALGRSEQHGIL